MAWLKEGLLLAGMAEGQGYVIEARYSDGDYTRFPTLVAQLLAAAPGVLVAFTLPAAKAAQALTSTVPIVMVANDPVGQGLATSLARPGGNVTGIATMNEDLTLKTLEIVREVLPSAKRFAAMTNPRNASGASMLAALTRAAAASGIAVRPVEVATPAALAGAFEEVSRERAEVVFIIPDTALVSLSPDIVAGATARGIPVVGNFREQASVGALVTYGRVRRATVHRMASYIKRIADGANPADLPIEQPTQFELSVNAKTAAALGLAIPASILTRADEVIE
jgi:putative ABC transport system substrate-binding protein